MLNTNQQPQLPPLVLDPADWDKRHKTEGKGEEIVQALQILHYPTTAFPLDQDLPCVEDVLYDLGFVGYESMVQYREENLRHDEHWHRSAIAMLVKHNVRQALFNQFYAIGGNEFTFTSTTTEPVAILQKICPSERVEILLGIQGDSPFSRVELFSGTHHATNMKDHLIGSYKLATKMMIAAIGQDQTEWAKGMLSLIQAYHNGNFYLGL